ncbi:pimeloyl-ACP methyl ester carboxylesterase [Kitasatospora kifunensis]|uniref:Pimeloyl-ACP methyl ester carboxylesterase n=1 Tax=Kitasatospora kifunensis TaxID=58351 RepID=A0A7W7VXB6_KITKI|nr:pimeloyl-ACP methyl ester carboxylesterase [Kitasatospora kifunensis]
MPATDSGPADLGAVDLGPANLPPAAGPPLPVGARLLRVDGTVLHVRCEGSGPVCVLSGGLGCAWFDWDAVAALLVPHRTVVRFDRPGYGLSASAAAAPTLRGEAERIRRILSVLGLAGPATVVGHSMAAFHVEAFARLHPERTSAVVLVDGSTEPHARERPLPRARVRAARLAAGVARGLAVPYLLGPPGRRLVVRLATACGRDPAPRLLVRRCYRPWRALRAALLENTCYRDQAAQLLVLRAELPLPAPVVVLAADDGSASRRARRHRARQRQLALALGGRLTVAAPSGHLLMLDRPEAVAAAVLTANDSAD